MLGNQVYRILTFINSLSKCFYLQINRSGVVCRLTCNQRFTFALRCTKAEIYGQRVPVRVSNVLGDWSFMVGSRISIRPNLQRFQAYRRSCVVRASCNCSLYPLLYSMCILKGNDAHLVHMVWVSSVVLIMLNVSMQKKPLQKNLMYICKRLLKTILINPLSTHLRHTYNKCKVI